MFPEYIQPTTNVHSSAQFLAEVDSYSPSSSYKLQFHFAVFVSVPEFCIQQGQKSQCFPNTSNRLGTFTVALDS